MPIFYLDSGSIDNLEISSSLLVSGALVISGSLQTSEGGLTGSLLGTASLATTASYYQLVTGSAGTNFNIVATPSGSIINIPTASSTNTGLITNGTQTIAGIKTFSGQVNIAGNTVFNSNGLSAGIEILGSAASQSIARFNELNPLNSQLGLTANVSHVFNYLNNSQNIIEASTGTHQLFSLLALKRLNLTNGGATTTNAATLYIEGDISGSANPINNYAVWVDSGSVRFDGDLIMSQSNIIVTGSVNASAGFTGSLFGTASYVTGSVFTSANPALSASYALSSSFALSASWAPGGSGTPGGNPNELQYNNAGTFDGVPVATYDGTTLRVTGSFTGSLTGQLIGTASWADNSVTASYVTGSVFDSTNPALSASYALSSSFAVSASYALSSSFAVSASYAPTVLVGGQDQYITRWEGSNTITTSSLYEGANKNIGINTTTFDGTNPEALLVSASTFNVISGEANINTYVQLNIINNSNGAQSSADIVATNNAGTETGNYVDLGINGSNYGGALGAPNEAYLFNTGSNFIIGNTTRGANANLKLFAGNDGTIFPVVVTGSVAILTGSLLGTASFATTAATASSIGPLNQSVVITGSVILSSSVSTQNELTVIGQTVITGSLIVSGAQGNGVFSKGGTIADFNNLIATSASYFVWRAPYSASVVALFGRRETGSATTAINARKSGSGGYLLHTASNLVLGTDLTWTQANSVQNTTYAAGESLEIIISGSDNKQVAVQVDFIKL